MGYFSSYIAYTNIICISEFPNIFKSYLFISDYTKLDEQSMYYSYVLPVYDLDRKLLLLSLQTRTKQIHVIQLIENAFQKKFR